MGGRILGLFILFSICMQSFSATLYVSLGGTHVPPFADWATAANDIQSAVDAATAGDTIIVTNGVYDTGSRVTPDYTSMNRVVITKDITVQSVNGPNSAYIVGQGPLGSSAVRGVYMSAGLLSGFTVTNGHTMTSGSYHDDQSGGGIKMSYNSSGIASNCILVSNSAHGAGGGSAYSTLNNCILSGNTADGGGGSYYGILNSCLLIDNSATFRGGGSSEGALNNCVLTGNSADVNGGGSFLCIMNNCTLAGNMTSGDGGGNASGELSNCIIYFNTADGLGDNSWYNSVYSNCCTIPVPSGGVDIITNNPKFMNASSGNFYLAEDSPCIDAGSNVYVSTTTDLDGNPRIINGTVDIGAYEFDSSWTVDLDDDGIPDVWEIMYFGHYSNCAALANSDADSHSNSDEYVAGTDPTNSTSYFKVGNGIADVNGTNCFIVEWTSVSNRLYSVYWNTNLFSVSQALETTLEYPINSYTDILHNAESAGFYKIDVQIK